MTFVFFEKSNLVMSSDPVRAMGGNAIKNQHFRRRAERLCTNRALAKFGIPTLTCLQYHLGGMIPAVASLKSVVPQIEPASKSASCELVADPAPNRDRQ